jgi:hypothetical protein
MTTRNTPGVSCARSYRTLRDGSFERRFPRHFVPGYDRTVPLGTVGVVFCCLASSQFPSSSLVLGWGGVLRCFQPKGDGRSQLVAREIGDPRSRILAKALKPVAKCPGGTVRS